MVDLSPDQIKDIDDVFSRSHKAEDAWDSRVIRGHCADVTATWVLGLAEWKNFTTLTFKDITPPDKAKRNFYSLIEVLNEELLGKHYTRKVGHSYFSYVVGIEYQKRDVIHFHMITDSPIHFDRIHTFWNFIAGFAWTEIIKDRADTVRYLAKYTLKGGDLEIYKAKKKPYLARYPSWWADSSPQMELLVK